MFISFFAWQSTKYLITKFIMTMPTEVKEKLEALEKKFTPSST
jgi:hypothetical protein